MERNTDRPRSVKTVLAGRLLQILAAFALMAGLCAQGSNAQTNGAPQKKTETYDLLVFSNPVPGAELEYNRWYSEQHQQDVVSIPGFKTAQRFVISDVQLRESQPLPKYLIVYRIVTGDLASVYAEVNRRIETGVTLMSPAYDRANSINFTYRTIRPVVYSRSISSNHKDHADAVRIARTASQGASQTYVQVVFSDPTTAALEDEYNRWYDTHHELDVVSAPGFVEAQRFVLSDIQLGNKPALAKYLVTYKIVSDDIAVRFADYRRLAPSMSTSPAMGMSFGYTYKAMEPPIDGDQVRAERAARKSALLERTR